jgi:hypothetical protein
MPSLLEFNIAERMASATDDAGHCNHAGIAHAPCGIGEIEAKKLSRFDPESFEKLQGIGINIENIEIQDFDYIAQTVPALTNIKSFDSNNSDILYKHAIAVRLERDLLIANGCPECAETINISIAFGHDYHVLD